jgi:uracil phosphoribosyltransferase
VLAAPPAFHTPLILLAAVHHLLLSGADGALAAYYATVSGDAGRPVDDQLYPAFTRFVDAHLGEIHELVATHTTQTNEVRRTGVTLPALGLVARHSGRPLALLEVGASAGLNLLVDRYGFRIGSVMAGIPGSPVQLRCAVEGELRPPVPDQVSVAWRLGIDLHPLDVGDPDTRSWLRALVWPEHGDRMEQLETALELARLDPPTVVPGDLAVDVPGLAEPAPRDAALVVISTWVLPYVSPELRLRFVDSLRQLAAGRDDDVWLVAGEGQSVLASLDLELTDPAPDGYGPSKLALIRFAPDGTIDSRLLAECHAHGRWIRWLDRDSAVGGGPRRVESAAMDAARYPALHVSNHPLIAHKLSILRDVGTDTKKFRELVRELTWLLGYETMADLATRPREVETPLERMQGAEVDPKVGLVPVLRAGLGMVDAMLELIPSAQVWHIGLYRDERTLKPVEYYNKLPDAATVQVCLILDPMLATGGSSAATVDILKAWGASRIKQVSLIAAPEGIATLSAAHPDVDIHVAAVDRELNERGYIVPGLGDAGDRQFGTFAGPASEPGHGPTDETAKVVRRLQRDLAGS